MSCTCSKTHTTRPDVITAVNGKASTKKCGNSECNVRETEAPLKACTRCKSQRYCSRECQSAHWSRHKISCDGNIDIKARFAAADAKGVDYGLPKGLTLVQLNEKLAKWVNFHVHLLMAATMHALEIPRGVNRARTHFLHVQISHREEDDGVNARACRLIETHVIDMDFAAAHGSHWLQFVEQVKAMQEESEALDRGTVAVIVLQCKPLPVQVVPFGSIVDLSSLKIQTQWKELLKRGIDKGKFFSQFGMSDGIGL